MSAEDNVYLEEISPALIALMRGLRLSSPKLDYLISATREGDESRVYAIPRDQFISDLRTTLRDDPNDLIQQVIDRVSQPPSSPHARWIVLSRDGRHLSVCSVMDVDLSRSVDPT